MPKSILLAEDHPLFRRGVQALFENNPDYSVVAFAEDGIEAVRLVGLLKPDILVLDLIMRGLGGLEVLDIVSTRSPRTRVVMLSMHDGIAIVSRALQKGARGYVLKECAGELLIHAVTEAVAGRRFLSPPLSQSAVNRYNEQSKVIPDPRASITARQRRVLEMVAEGITNKEIAVRLNISPRTVENHRRDVMHRLGLRNHTELMQYAIRNAVISAIS